MGHSPALSQIGQSRGWLMSKNSRTPSCAFLTVSDSVSTINSSLTCVVQEGTKAFPIGVSI